MSLNVGNLISQFDGGDIMEWIGKVELVARLQKQNDLCSFLPLFLLGGAFKVYDSLSDKTKRDYGRLKKALIRAFSVDKY